MYYASIGIISLLVHIIINNVALRKVENSSENSARYKYRQYLLAITIYFISDALWGIFYDLEWIAVTYIDTILFFMAMVSSVLFWTRAVVAFTKNNGRLGRIIVGAGWTIFVFQVLVLIINLFIPIAFSFDKEGVYQALPIRYVILFMQMVLFFASAIYSFVIAFRSEGEKRFHYRTVGFSGIIMAIFIDLQMVFPLMPFYSLGCLFATCLIHAFVYKDKDEQFSRKIEVATQKAYRDGLTGVKNKLAYLETLASIETGIEEGSLKEYGVVVFDLNGLKTINDTLGHEAGDEYIKKASMIICQQFKHSPVFRIGGDEFVAILKGEDYANREELEASFIKTIDENQKNGTVVVSSGLAAYIPDIDESYNDVFKRADELMYARKKALKAMK